MTPLPPREEARAKQAVERVLVDLGQVLAAYMDRIVLVGGLSPGLLFGDADPPHSGSIDIDVALEAESLDDGDYVCLLETLLETDRYRFSEDTNKRFRLITSVDLDDGLGSVEVPVDFLASPEAKFRRSPDRRMRGFRVLQADGCGTAFLNPQSCMLRDKPDAKGTLNSVEWRVIAVENLLVMKAFALGGREKKKDAYDIVFCLTQLNESGMIGFVAEEWKSRSGEPDVQEARRILADKFRSKNHIGPQWYAEYLGSSDEALNARTAFELVREFLGMLGD